MRFSNDMKDACKALCLICKTPVYLTSLRGHTRNHHNLPIEEYKKTYGNPRKDIVEKVFHRCGICSEILLHNSDDIAFHLRRRHQDTTHKNYNAKFMAPKKNLYLVKEEKNIPIPTEDASLDEKMKALTEITQRIRAICKEDVNNISTPYLLRLIDDTLAQTSQ